MILDQSFLELLKSSYVTFDLMIKDGQIGSKRSKAKGSSVEFSDYRAYTLGDDFRRIDWNAYARFEKLFVKLFLEEREARINVFLDMSKSMSFYEKKEAGMKVAAAFTYYALAGYDAGSLVEMGPSISRVLKSIKGTGSFHRAVSFLESATYEKDTDIFGSISGFQNQLSKGMTVIISDFLGDHDYDKIMKLLHYKKQKIYLVHILSKEELEPEFEEHVRLIDSENGAHLELMMGSDMVSIYKKAMENHINNIQKACRKYQANYVTYNSETSFDVFLKQLL
jgi:uncharacterized protein (DUF58 family)